MSRSFAARALVVLACVTMLPALLAGYARRAAVDSDQFANRATAALQNDNVSSLVATRITDDVVLAREGDLLAARPIIESVTGGLVTSRAFTSLFRGAVRDAHRALLRGERDTVTLTVADAGTVVAAALERLRPELAGNVRAAGAVTLVERDNDGAGATLIRIADTVRLVAALLLALCIALVAAALAASTDRRRTAVELGIGTAGAGVALVVGYGIARSLVLGPVEGAEAHAAAGAIWDAFLADLRTAGWILAAAGAVVAGAAGSVIRPVELGEPLRRAAGRLRAEPRRPALRVLRAIAMAALGVTIIAAPDTVLALALTAVGVYLVFEGVTALLRVIYRPPAPGGTPVRERRSLVALADRRGAVAGLLAGVLIVAAVAAFVGGGGTTTAAPAPGPCNGHAQLCERSLPEIALAATHNSMSVPLPGWFSAVNERPIGEQLADGIRGLLIDTHYADRLPNGRLRTVLGDGSGARTDGVSPDAVKAALRIRDRLGFAGKGERGIYLCHSFCELGGTPLAPVLGDLRDFLVANPDEVVVIINQDYVTPQDVVGAVRDAGLERFTYRPPASGRWATLREMIDSGRRLVMLAENEAGGAPWYQAVYERITQETPYAFSSVRELTDRARLPASCKANRGPADAPLFLLNHWTTTDPVPLPSHATQLNAYDALLARARECQRLRDRRPNLVAVNFYRRGDLLRVVDTLNGVR